MLSRYRPWSGALIAMVITAALVILDISDGAVHRFWSRHSFTSNVVAGVCVLFVTVLIVDRVARIRQAKSQISCGRRPLNDREEASAEVRTYTQLLLNSAPLLIDARIPRAFLEAAQRMAAELFRAAAAPLLRALSSEQRAAISQLSTSMGFHRS